MTELLLDHIQRYVPLKKEAQEQITALAAKLDLRKKEIIINEGESCAHIYFVTKGCLRMFYVDEKGTEQTIQLAIENWWMTDIEAFNKNVAASFSVQAIENTSLLALHKHDFKQLLETHPGLEKYFRHIYERAYSAALFKMKFFRLPKEEIYAMFRHNYPGFLQRIPQKYLASFLSFTPEYLSELRKKKN